MIRVLLVDDQKSVIKTLQSILESVADFKVVGMASIVFEAIELVQELQPDVVLMDLEMPDIDGNLATKIITQGQSGHEVKVLVVSSNEGSNYIAQSLEAGAKGYLNKGASAAKIQEAVRLVHQGDVQIHPATAATSNEEQQSSSASTGISSLVLCDVEVEEDPVEDSTVFEEFHASQMLVDVEPIQVDSRWRLWHKLSALTIVALGSMGGAYWLNQRLGQPTPSFLATGQQSSPPVIPINAIKSGFIHKVKVKVGQQVQLGEYLLEISNANSEKIHQEQVKKQHNFTFQQQAIQEQQQVLLQQQQFSEQRIASLRRQVISDQQKIALLRSKIASVSSPVISYSSSSGRSAVVQKQQKIVQTAQTVYQQKNNEYRRKQQLIESQQRLSETKNTANQGFDRLITDAEFARVEMELARSNYDNAQVALQAAQQSPANLESLESPMLKVQQQLEQEDKLRKLQEQLLQEQLGHRQLASNLQSLKQQVTPSPEPQVSESAPVEPLVVDVLASKSGYVVKLLVRNGDPISTGETLIEIVEKP